MLLALVLVLALPWLRRHLEHLHQKLGQNYPLFRRPIS